ncbi:hypothetical protein GGR56DRAFT_157137 [Xylariaceae sp. FL0804]|nr:hypothetical protein GGR56DRAFT_157137 [Xylariaceae sp. FL0804]
MWAADEEKVLVPLRATLARSHLLPVKVDHIGANDLTLLNNHFRLSVPASPSPSAARLRWRSYCCTTLYDSTLREGVSQLQCGRESPRKLLRKEGHCRPWGSNAPPPLLLAVVDYRYE